MPRLTHKVLSKLLRYGFQPDLATLFSWLGVVPYLTRNALVSTLAEILNCVTDSCQLIVAFMAPLDLLAPEDQEEVRRLSTDVAQAGEPIISYYVPDEMRSILQEAGFDTVHHFSPDAAMQRYFTGRTDGLHLSGIHHLMNARREKVRV